MMNEQESRDFVYFKIPVFCVDLSIHISVMLILLKILPSIYIGEMNDLWSTIVLIVLLAGAFSISISIIGLKLQMRGIKFIVALRNVLCQSTLTYILFIAFIAMTYKNTPRQFLIYQFLLATTLVTMWHCMVVKSIRTLRKFGHNTRSVVIIGSDADIDLLCDELNEGEGVKGYKIRGIFSNSKDIPNGINLLGSVDDFFIWSKSHQVEIIYCALNPYVYHTQIAKVVHICNDHMISLSFVPSLDAYPRREMSLGKLGTVTVMRFRHEPMNSLISKFWKRFFDIFVSSIFLCSLFPFVLLFVWTGNRITGDNGPVFFRQNRTGYNGKRFRIFKFRSMKANIDADRVQATKDDPRKTTFGTFLRNSSIDELPQFINILRGEMSLIGPRPHMEYHTEMYSSLIGEYMVRHLVKPGITGWAQVNGCRGETKNVSDMANRVKYDVWYIENWSIWLDFKILIMTFNQVFLHRDMQAY